MKKKILIVEDDEQLALALLRQLEAAGYKACAAHNGDEGLFMAKRENPDLMLLDITMPVMDGKTLCGIIKMNSATKGIKVIMLTGEKLVGQMEDSFSAGAELYINKPYDLPRLLAHIKELIG